MSVERQVETPGTGEPDQQLAALQERDPEELKRIRAEKKARFVRILERGMTVDKLHVPLPDHLYGEWILNDPISIREAETLGFRVDTEYAPKSSLHNQGTNLGVVGDTVFMVMPREDKEILDEIRQEEFASANLPKKQGEQKEEREFETMTTRHGLPVIEESKTRSLRKEELKAALENIAAAAAQKTGTPPASVPIK